MSGRKAEAGRHTPTGARQVAKTNGVSRAPRRPGQHAAHVLIVPVVETLGSVGGALWAGAAVCLLSMGCAVALGLLDAHHVRRIRRLFKLHAPAHSGADGDRH